MTSDVRLTLTPVDKPPHMTRLSPSISLYRPSSSLSVVDPTAPKLILLAAWMDARDAHIVKYVTRYQALYPTATILLAKSFFRYYFSSSTARREVAPAVQVIRDVVPFAVDDAKPRMLIHVFSNGGSCVLYHLYDLYAETSMASKFLPRHVTIFDSVPGRWSYSGSTRAILVSLPAGWVRRLAFPLVHLLGFWWIIKYVLLKVPEETHVWGLAHNDPARAQETCRGYVYSEGDKFVHHRHVEEHADHAEVKGYIVVRRDKFPKESLHVAHARADPDRYWALVTDTWWASQQDKVLPKSKV